MNNTEFINYQKEIDERFSDDEKTNLKLPIIIASLLFVAGLALSSYKFYLTGNLSTVDFLIDHPGSELKILTLDFSSLILMVGPMFASIILLGISEKNKYLDLAKKECVDFLNTNKEKITLNDLIKKINEEIMWVRKNI